MWMVAAVADNDKKNKKMRKRRRRQTKRQSCNTPLPLHCEADAGDPVVPRHEAE